MSSPNWPVLHARAVAAQRGASIFPIRGDVPGVEDEVYEYINTTIWPCLSVLGLDTDCILPGYEDVWYYLWRERQLPVNVDPFDSRLDDELERERLRRVFKNITERSTRFLLHLLLIKNLFLIFLLNLIFSLSSIYFINFIHFR